MKPTNPTNGAYNNGRLITEISKPWSPFNPDAQESIPTK